MPGLLRAVFFDLGNTLLYYDGVAADVFEQSTAATLAALTDAGLRLDEAEFPAVFGSRLKEYHVVRETEFIETTTRAILADVLTKYGYPDTPDEVIRAALAAMYAQSQAHWHLEADAHAMLAALHGRYQLAIISNAADNDDVQKLVDKANLRPYFDLILTSAAVGIRKPQPQIFYEAMIRMDVRPEESVMVGDTLGADILGALNVGMSSVWITRRANTAENREVQDVIVPDAAIATLAELPPLLAGWKAS
ncbi:MAG TPA: HAD family hydrolase [Anaerolineaceae bacterium]|nr:HAD family hydrolase [Anaerolineaceae bacterium]HPN51617.1 HAD family hydrolase [Anaerolineaceae bacterium]